MSTKIYSGVRFPRVRLGEFVRLVRVRGLERVYERALELVDNVDMSSDIVKEKTRLAPDKKPRDLRIDHVLTEIGEAADSNERNPIFDLESAWRVWVPTGGRWIFAIPWGEGLNHVKLPSWVEPYGYWDNVDREEGVSSKAWAKRGEDWQIACEPSHNNHQMLVEVFTIEKRTRARGLNYCWLELRLRRGPEWGKPR